MNVQIFNNYFVKRKSKIFVRDSSLGRSFEHVKNIICTTNYAYQSNDLKVISDLLITLPDEFEKSNVHLDQKRPRTFKCYELKF